MHGVVEARQFVPEIHQDSPSEFALDQTALTTTLTAPLACGAELLPAVKACKDGDGVP